MRKQLVIGVYLVLTGGPLFAGLGYSLAYSLGLTGLLNEGFTLHNWQRLWSGSDALLSLGYSLYLTVASLALILPAAVLFAWWQYRKGRGGLFHKILFLPLTFPPLIAAFAWYYLLSPGGLLSRASFQAGFTGGIGDFPRLVNDAWGIGILLTHLFLIFPLFAILFAHQAEKERMGELEAISRTLGGSDRQFLQGVFAPLLLKRSSPLIVLYAIFLFGAYEVPLLLGRSSPRVATLFITEKMTKYNLLDVPVGHAMAVVYTLSVITLATLLLRRGRFKLFEV